MTEIIQIDPIHPQKDPIERAAALLRAGQVVAFPTETVYGLGANALDADAVEKIFLAKDRPAYDPLIVHLKGYEWLPQVVREVHPNVPQLAARFWPGPLTLILPRQPVIPDRVTAGLDTVAVRVPAHPVAQALLAAADLPVAAPSANRFGYTSPTIAAHVLADLGGRIPLILDGGPTQIGVESTVLDLTRPVPTILRPGGITREALESVLGQVELARQPGPEEAAQPSPGLLPRHYAPHAHLVLFRSSFSQALPALRGRVQAALAAGRKIAILLQEEDLPALLDLRQKVELRVLSRRDDLLTFSQNLYAALRDLDQIGADEVFVCTLPDTGLGLAINNRLTKAAAEVISLPHTI